MKNNILLDGKKFDFNESFLPCLVTYKEKTGGSHFTITMVKDLFLSGSKILFLTAYPMAKENFLEQIGEDHSKIAFVNSVSDLENAKNSQVIILESGNEQLFLDIAKEISDLEERVILVKNIEIFSEKVFDICLNLKKVILSGHLDECVDKERISKKEYETIIAFSNTEISLPISIPELEKYNGYLQASNYRGIVKIEKD